MTPKEAHEFARRHAIACPACGHAVVITANSATPEGDPDVLALHRAVQRLRAEGRLVLVQRPSSPLSRAR